MINWDAVSGIGSVCASIATFCAVIVSLWQTRLKTRKCLQFEFSPSVIGIGDIGVKDEPYISLSVTNICQRKIKIVSWGIILKYGHKACCCTSTMGCLGDNLPTLLEPDVTANLFTIRKSFYQTIQKYNSEKFLDKNSKLKMYVTDASGSIYVYTTKCKIKNFLK